MIRNIPIVALSLPRLPRNVTLLLTLLFVCACGQTTSYEESDKDVYDDEYRKPAMRIRLNDLVYDQAENIIEALFSWQVHRTVIPTQQQCFAEGCVSIFSFRISSFRPPSTIVLQPTPPNVLSLKLENFDLDITGQVSGTLQMLLPIPVTGRILVHARNVVLHSEMEMQKTRSGVAFMKLSSCGIQDGLVDAKIVDMGLFTDTVNTKYRTEIVDKAKSLLESVLCDNVNKILKSEFNARLADIPKKLYVEDVVRALLGFANETERFKRENKNTFIIKALPPHEGRSGVATITEITRRTSIRLQDAPKTKRFLNESAFFSPSNFEGLFVDLDMVDTSATNAEFTIGIDGTVLKEQAIQVDNIPYARPEKIRFTKVQKKQMLELLISEYTLNSLLFQAYSFNALRFHVTGKTPILGPLLRTSCSLDEVCLSDSIEEAAEQYPDKQLELVVYPIKAPRITVHEDSADLIIRGLSEYYLEDSGELIGSIPFSADVELGLHTKNSKIHGSLKVKNLEFHDPVDFFQLRVEHLDGLRKATIGAVENLASQKFDNPIDLSEVSQSKFERFGVQNVTVRLLEQGAAMVQTDFDLYRTFYGQ